MKDTVKDAILVLAARLGAVEDVLIKKDITTLEELKAKEDEIRKAERS